jgi:tyrosine-specific transport protein
MKHPFSKILSGALLVSGTAIGAGMLALPIATGIGGFLPALVMYILCWLFMAATGLLLLEVCLWMPKDANIVSMASHLLGRKGKMISWVLYLFLFYCLTIAYVAGGGGFVSALFQGFVSNQVGIVLFTLIFAPIVYIGTRAVDRVNMFLMIGLGVSYFAFVFLGTKHVQWSFLAFQNWPVSLLALPVIFTSFSYQGIIPSLTSYMQNHAKMVRKAIWIGTALPFVIYVIWEFLILGIVPIEGEHGLSAAKALGQNAVYPLKHFVQSPWIYAIGQAFAFFALTTSFLGVTLGLLDFLADGLKIKKEGKKKLALCLLVFFPPLIIALSHPDIFISALTYAGGIGCALLLGLMPVIMVWTGRYKKGYGNAHSQIGGGKGFLIALSVFVVFEVIIECISEYLG